MYYRKEIKKTFSIVLNAWDHTSWTGAQFNATFPIDLTKILDPEDFAKTYEMRFTFRTRRTNAAGDIDPATSVYHLAINFNKGFTSQSFTQQYNIVGIVPVSNETTAYTAINNPNYFDAKPHDNVVLCCP